MDKEKKTLDTLVQDIYDKLDELTAGTALDISDQTANNFGDAMKQALVNWGTPYTKDKQRLRMSNVGKPNRQLWFDMNSKEKTSSFSAPVQVKFLYGHSCEEILLFLARLAGHEVTDEQKEVTVDGIKGHMDCKIDGEVVDIKTASGFAFRKFKELKLKSKLVLTVHDSLVADVFPNEIDQVKDALEWAMVGAIGEAEQRWNYTFALALEIEITGGKNWLDQIEFD